MGNADNVLFDNDSRVAPLGLIALYSLSVIALAVRAFYLRR